MTGTPKVITKLPITTQIFRLLSPRTDFRPRMTRKRFYTTKAIITELANALDALLVKRQITLGLTVHLDNVTATAHRCIRTLTSCPARFMSAHGAAPNLHLLRGCTAHINNTLGRHLNLSSTIVVGSGRVTATKNVQTTISRIRHAVPCPLDVRMRADSLTRIGRTLTYKISVVVLSGVAPTTVARTIRIVQRTGPHVGVRTSNGIALSALHPVTRANMSFVSDDTPVAHTP